MWIRRTSIKRNGKTYRYAQVVESYRRAGDGMPSHKVIANLGDLSELEVENLRTALRASKEGRAVVVKEPAVPSAASRITANLRYLDLAVLLEAWRTWQLDRVLDDLLPKNNGLTRPADVVTALVLHRCADPGSKLHAQRWLPTTTLPQLLDLPKRRFNNTRVHRVLEDLHRVTPSIQEALPRICSGHGVSHRAFFLDVSDTYFEGRGCEMAKRHRTKSGIKHKWSIGVLLLTNEDGLPLRWRVISRKLQDHQAMGEEIDRIKGFSWLKGTPIAVDRAMGNESSVAALLRSGVHFLTASPIHCIESYTDQLPHQPFADLEIGGTSSSPDEEKSRAAECARAVGFEEMDKDTFFLDLGVVPFRQLATPPKKSRRPKTPSREHLSRALRYREMLDSGTYSSGKEIAKAEGIHPTRASAILRLLALAPEIQDRIMSSPSVDVSCRKLLALVKEPDHRKQVRAFEELLKSEFPLPSLEPHLRLVAYFSPDICVERRRRARQRREEIENYVEQLNEELAHALQTRKERATYRKVARKLEKYGYSDVFDVALQPIERTSPDGKNIASFRIRLEVNEKRWQRKQRYFGFNLLVAHPEIRQSGGELISLYREKDAVERGFRTIKSEVKLRPVFHHTDRKVQAHVTLCALALLLERILEARLKAGTMALSMRAALEVLRTCHLNRLAEGADQDVYSLTEPNEPQREILSALAMDHLRDPETVAETIAPRF